MSAIGAAVQPLQPFEIGSVSASMGSSASIINETSASLVKADTLTTSNINAGSIPAVKTNISGKPGPVSGVINGVSRAASAAVNTTVNTTKEVGSAIKNDILPQPESLNATAIRNKFLSAIIFGGVMNGVKAIVEVGKGEVSSKEATAKVVKETAMGAATGVAFVGGMTATSAIFGTFMSGLPLSVVTLLLGSVAAVGVTEVIKTLFPDKNTSA